MKNLDLSRPLWAIALMPVLLMGAAPAAAENSEAIASGEGVVTAALAQEHGEAAAAAIDVEKLVPVEVEEEISETPAAESLQLIGSGQASYYGKRFAGRRTANGETFDPAKLTAAHRTLPMGSIVRVVNERNGKEVTVRINDRGPFHGNRIIDLSRAAADQIGMVSAGKAQVRLSLVK